MTDNEYLKNVLQSQELKDKSTERKELQKIRGEVEDLLRKAFKDAHPTIRLGGSYVKETLIRESYDLDVICYFPHDETSAGETLADIYDNVKEALESEYFVEPKTSALRLRGKAKKIKQVDFHVDVVPGRFVDGKKEDAFLFLAQAEKKRLKTNLDEHIRFIKDSGFTDAIKLIKLWKVRRMLNIKTFILELVVIKILTDNKGVKNLDEQLTTFWSTLVDKEGQIAIEDPANPSGNDLSPIYGIMQKSELATLAESTLQQLENDGWESVFGELDEASNDEKVAVITAASQNGVNRSKPWGLDY